METFIGKSKNFYVQNPFKKELYAVYKSKDQYENKTGGSFGFIEYRNKEECFEDFAEAGKSQHYIFEVRANGKLDTIETDLQGNMKEPRHLISNFKDYLQKLYNDFGKDNVSYKIEKV